MAIAVFNFAAWQAMYPELAAVPEAVASSYFTLATLYLDNTDCSPVADANLRLVFLNMITAHLVKLFYAVGGQAPSGTVGRVEEAQEGSVRVKLAEIKGADSVAAAFFLQTPYGLAFWAATGYLRRGFYVPGPEPVIDPWTPFFAGNGYGGWPWSPG